MYVTQHAWAQLHDRLTSYEAAGIVDTLEARVGSPGLVALVVRRLSEARGPMGQTSNGDLVVAIVDDASVVTVMYRRSTQPLTREALGVSRVEDIS